MVFSISKFHWPNKLEFQCYSCIKLILPPMPPFWIFGGGPQKLDAVHRTTINQSPWSPGTESNANNRNSTQMIQVVAAGRFGANLDARVSRLIASAFSAWWDWWASRRSTLNRAPPAAILAIRYILTCWGIRPLSGLTRSGCDPPQKQCHWKVETSYVQIACKEGSTLSARLQPTSLKLVQSAERVF